MTVRRLDRMSICYMTSERKYAHKYIEGKKERDKSAPKTKTRMKSHRCSRNAKVLRRRARLTGINRDMENLSLY